MDYAKISQELSEKLNKTISGQWLELVHALAQKELPSIDHLKPAIVGQWILECGRGSTRLFKEYWNPAGMKWRAEMEGYATSVYYETDSEPTGGADFCKFADAKGAVNGYFQFLSRAPYVGWRNHTSTAMDWLGFIGETWCPPGYKEGWIEKHGGLKYHEYIIDSFWDEAVDTLKAVGWKQGKQPQESLDATWFEANRTDDGKAVFTAYAHSKAVTNLYGNPSVSASDLKALLDKYATANNILVAETDKKIIPQAPRWPEVLENTLPPPQGRLKGIKILLDAGHSKSKRGAGGLPPDKPDEWEHNVIACQVLKEALEKEGARCYYEDPDPDNLEYMGRLAKGYDIAIYSHHNAFDKDGVDEGTGIYIHPQATPRCKDFCKFAVAKVAAAIGNHNRGVDEKRFTVLEESYKVGCPVSLLPEYYFIDDYGSTSVTKPKTRKAAQALAKAIIEYFGNGERTPEDDYITLKLGSKGPAVSRLQSELNEHGANLKVDGDFGPKTLEAVKAFQASKGLTVDGIVGEKTWEAVLKTPPPPGPVMDKLAAIAKKHALANYKESDGTYNYFRRKFFGILGSSNWPWCAAFVHKCLEEACGRSLPLSPGTGPASYALCESWQKWAQKKGYWHDAPGFNPPKGAITLFDWSGACYPDKDYEDHIGVFLYKEGSAYVCAEGNVQDMTLIKKRYLKNIQGFIVLPDDWTV